jgi:uncharacterized protein (DUF427 family)
MSEHIKIRKAPGTWSVRAGGAVLAESKTAMELTEGSRPFVIYFPRDDIAMDFLEKTDHTTTCPHKGVASYYSIVTKSTVLKNAAWSYETPNEGFEAITGHLAFYSSDTVAVEQI